ncbi:hypothetical protein ACRRTK_014551 [Alexandromys fortis]
MTALLMVTPVLVFEPALLRCLSSLSLESCSLRSISTSPLLQKTHPDIPS